MRGILFTCPNCGAKNRLRPQSSPNKHNCERCHKPLDNSRETLAKLPDINATIPYRHWSLDWKKNRRPSRKSVSLIYGGLDDDILQAFYNISPAQLERLLGIYAKEYKESVATYVSKTYSKWKSGIVQPSGQTVERLILLLPLVLEFRIKCELLRRLRERHRKLENYELTVNISNWMEVVTPLVESLINKAYSAQLPETIEQRLEWLSTGDMKVAQAILAEAEAQEARNATALLKEEFKNIERLLTSLPGEDKITHTIKLPYGRIKLTIRRYRTWRTIIRI